MLARLLKQLVDRAAVPSRGLPRDERDLVIAARNSWVLVYGPLVSLPRWCAEALARVAAGEGFATRKLYTDDEEIVFQSRRPIILDHALDMPMELLLATHSVQIVTGAASPTQRDIEQQLAEDHATILGFLLDTASQAIARYRVERTTGSEGGDGDDFCRFGQAVSDVLDWDGYTFLEVLQENKDAEERTAFDVLPYAQVLRRVEHFSGSATELLDRLNANASDEEKRGLDWPGSAQALSTSLRRNRKACEAVGIGMDFGKESGGIRKRTIQIYPVTT